MTDIKADPTLRRGTITLRTTTEVAASRGFVLSATLAHVYWRAQLITVLRNGQWTCPPGVYDQLTVEPILDCSISQGPVATVAIPSTRYIANVGDRPCRTNALYDSQHGPGGVDPIQLDDLRISIPTGSSIPDVVNDGFALPLLQVGTTVIEEDFAPTRAFELPAAFSTFTEPYFIVITINTVAAYKAGQHRLVVQFGRGTTTYDLAATRTDTITWDAAIVMWPDASQCEGETTFVAGLDAIKGVTHVKFGYVYPPYFLAGAMPRGSFQVYGIPFQYLDTRNNVSHQRGTLLEVPRSSVRTVGSDAMPDLKGSQGLLS